MPFTALSATTLLAAATLLLLFHPAAGLSASPARTSLESADILTLTRDPGEPPFSTSARYGCHFTRRGQFSIVLPQKGYKHGGVFVNVSATVLSGDTLRCDKPVGAVTAGNTTVNSSTTTPASSSANSARRSQGFTGRPVPRTRSAAARPRSAGGTW